MLHVSAISIWSVYHTVMPEKPSCKEIDNKSFEYKINEGQHYENHLK